MQPPASRITAASPSHHDCQIREEAAMAEISATNDQEFALYLALARSFI
jgi:hypothetical protein